MVASYKSPRSEEIERFCMRWNVRELALFGSVLRSDFGRGSDVDVLISFEPGAPRRYWEWPEITADLRKIFDRPVDLHVKEGLRNPIRREEILRTREVIYEKTARR